MNSSLFLPAQSPMAITPSSISDVPTMAVAADDFAPAPAPGSSASSTLAVSAASFVLFKVSLTVMNGNIVQVELVQNFEMGVSNKTPEFLAMNPIGKVPVLETPDGPIFESIILSSEFT